MPYIKDFQSPRVGLVAAGCNVNECRARFNSCKVCWEQHLPHSTGINKRWVADMKLSVCQN
jgi:hypothetical protein